MLRTAQSLRGWNTGIRGLYGAAGIRNPLFDRMFRAVWSFRSAPVRTGIPSARVGALSCGPSLAHPELSDYGGRRYRQKHAIPIGGGAQC